MAYHNRSVIILRSQTAYKIEKYVRYPYSAILPKYVFCNISEFLSELHVKRIKADSNMHQMACESRVIVSQEYKVFYSIVNINNGLTFEHILLIRKKVDMDRDTRLLMIAKLQFTQSVYA